MSIVSFETSMIMISIDSPIPTYSSIAEPISQSISQLRESVTTSFMDAYQTLNNYKGEITAEIQAAKDELDAIDLDKIMSFQFPNIPGLPLPIFPDFSNYAMEISEMIESIQQFQLMTTIKAMAEPLVAIIGGQLKELLPKDPIFGLDILDIMDMSGGDLYQMVYSKFQDLKNQAINLADAMIEAAEAVGEEAIAAAQEKVSQIQAMYDQAKALVEGFMDKLSMILPMPIFPDISALQMEAMEIVKAIKSFLLNGAVELVLGFINRVCGILELKTFLDMFPVKIPTIAEIKQMLWDTALSMLPDSLPFADDIAMMKALLENGISLDMLLAQLSIPGFPSIVLPNPLLPSFSSLAIEIQKACQILISDFIASMMKKLVDFVKSTLGMLGIQFPLLQIPFPALTMKIILPELPSLPDIPDPPSLG